MVSLTRRSILGSLGLFSLNAFFSSCSSHKQEALPLPAAELLFSDINPRSSTYGQYVSLEQRARASSGITLLNFWEPWCAPCLTELSSLEDLSQKGIPVVGVSLDAVTLATEPYSPSTRALIAAVTYPLFGHAEERAQIVAALDQSSCPYFESNPIRTSHSGQSLPDGAHYVVPTTVVLDSQFQVQEVLRGQQTFAAWLQKNYSKN